ncbi:MAG TPA: NADPH dehydrogenase NamA [Flavitalea sp.]|nr:NADPH dehydrogenase NamA [Flavitalea sp.]
MALLFQPLTIGNVTLKNRIVVSPMCEYSSEDGFINDWHIVHLGSRAVGGAGLVMTEAAGVSPEGRITAEDLGIYKDEHIEGLHRITKFIHAQNAVAGIQLAHAGRKASHEVPWKGGAELNAEDPRAWKTVAPSPIPFKDSETPPIELSVEGIQKVVTDFHKAAIRSIQAGFQVVEIHAAHGYLINSFLSPLSNQRKDKYGGSFENRCRLLLEIIDAVREVWTEEKPLFVRISASEWITGGWTIEDSVQLSKLMKERKVDLVDCSSGGNSASAKIEVKPLYQVPFAEKIRKQSNIKTAAVGLITKAEEAEEILKNEQADLIFFAREMLRDPYFPLHAAKTLGVDIPWPVQYERAKR